MECPNCKYTHGYHWDENDQYVELTGEHGDFYSLPIKLERAVMWRDDERARVYGCPQCKQIFLED